MHTDRPSDLAMDPDRRPRVLPPTAPPAGELVSRYSRQMLVPGLNGMPGQQSISSSSVLVVGAGGIGSTAIMYLAGAGVGRLGIADFDRVDLSNLHRQIIYRVDEVGLLKAECAKQRVSALNPTVDVIAITERVDCHNALEVIQDFDLVVDATDNFTVRYVLNDACVFLSIPLVSGAAVGLEGQATVFMPGAGCLRCVHPVPSTAEAGRSCAEVGVLGPVPGLIGCMEAIEAIKILVMRARVESSLQLMIGRQMYLDAAAGSCFEFTLPVRNLRCPLCGESPTILSMHDGAAASAIGAGYSVVAPSLSDNNEITAWDYFDKILVKSITHVLVDVRAAGQFNMLNLEPALELHKCCVKYLSLPLARIKKMGTEADLSNALQDPEGTLADIPIFVLCRRGVDSVTATIHIQSLFEQAGAIQRNVKNIKGGLVAWRRDVDNQFPNY